MSLIKCPECGKEISEKAESCPNCGMPLSKIDIKEYVNIDETQSCKSCGKPYSKIVKEHVATGVGGMWIFHDIGYCEKCNVKVDIDSVKNHKSYMEINHRNPQNGTNGDIGFAKPVHAYQGGRKCPRCGGIVFTSVENVVNNYGSRSEYRKKSVITNTANSIGRTGMIVATCGLWALTPKKSKYNTVEKGKAKTVQIKTAVCQNCGYSWKL